MSKKPLYLRIDEQKHYQLTEIANNADLSLNQLFNQIISLLLSDNIKIIDKDIYLTNNHNDSRLLNSDSTNQDMNNRIAYIQNDINEYKIITDKVINLLVSKIDKLSLENNSLNTDNINLNLTIEKLVNKIDGLANNIENILNVTNVKKVDLPLTDLSVTNLNSSSLTISQLQKALDQLGIGYRKKAPKSELMDLLPK